MKILKKTLKITVLAVLILAIITVIYSMKYYKADEIALAVSKQSNVEENGRYTLVTSEQPSNVGIIFYPGAKVEAISYLPLLDKLSQQGITSVMVEMPLNMAIFGTNLADKAFDIMPSNVDEVYIMGHSMGGSMATSYASKNTEKLQGAILLGAYIYGDYPSTDTLTIYGTFNDELEKFIDYTDNIVKIDGGNHAQFGNYGKQKGDEDATITAEDQQNQTVEAIINFINKD